MTDNERREVARRLREIEQGVIGALIPTGELAENILRAIDYGHSGAMTPYGCLADLIEPGEPKVKCVAEIKVDGERLEELVYEVIQELQGEEQNMRHEFLATIIGIADGTPNEADVEPPAIVSAYGLSGDGVNFSLREAARHDAAKWFGRRVRVTVETIGDE